MKVKKQKAQKTVSQEENLHFKIINTQLQAAQIENKINHLEKNEIVLNSSKEGKKEFVKNNKLIYKKNLEVKRIMFLLKKLKRLL